MAERARAELYGGPEIPEYVAYLYEWAVELHGRCGVSSSSILPLSHQEVRAWAELRDIAIVPHEVDALMRIDAVLRNPETGEDDGR